MQYQIKTTAQSVITLYVIHQSTSAVHLPEKQLDLSDEVLRHVSDLTQSLNIVWFDTREAMQIGNLPTTHHAEPQDVSHHPVSFSRVSHAITDIVPANHTIAFHYDSRRVSNGEMKRAVWAEIQLITQGLQAQSKNSSASVAEKVCLPVYYGDEVAWDLPELSELSGLSKHDMVQQHQAGKYRVSAVGFAPGFAYMQGLPAALQFPRLTVPRVQVPAGALAIAEHQTAIYPQASPAGWRIIGHCPVPLFTLHGGGDGKNVSSNAQTGESLLAMGNEVTFQTLEKQDYLAMLAENRDYFASSLRDVFPEVFSHD